MPTIPNPFLADYKAIVADPVKILPSQSPSETKLLIMLAILAYIDHEISLKELIALADLVNKYSKLVASSPPFFVVITNLKRLSDYAANEHDKRLAIEDIIVGALDTLTALKL